MVKVSRRRPSPSFSGTSAALDRRLAQNQLLPRLDTGRLDRGVIRKFLTRLGEERHQVPVGGDVEHVLGSREKRLDGFVRVVVERLRLGPVEDWNGGSGWSDSIHAVASRVSRRPFAFSG